MVQQRLSGAERRARTLRRVTEVFARRGFDGTTSADLARAAGISQAMLYKLFGSKRGIYQAMIEHKLAECGWGELPVDPQADSERAFFTGMAQAIFSKVEEDPDFVRLILYSELQGGEFAQLLHDAMGASVIEAVSAYLRERLEAGALRELDPAAVSLNFLCAVWQVALSTKVFKAERLPPVPDEARIESLVETFLHGVLA